MSHGIPDTNYTNHYPHYPDSGEQEKQPNILTMTSHYDIIKAWVDSCVTEPQLEVCKNFIWETLKTDDKQLEDIKDYYNLRMRHRAWIAAKVAAKEYMDEQPSDITNH